MEEYFETINRTALIIKPKQPLYDWVKSTDPSFTMLIEAEGTVYLVKERDSNEQIERWLKKNFKPIFENELFDWWQTDEYWPKPLTWKLFSEWFSYEIISMVWDLEGGIIRKD